MADEKTAKTLLKYEVDRKSLQDAITSVDLLESRLRGLSKSQDELTDSSQKLGSALRSSFSGGIDRSLRRLAELRTEAAKTKGTWDDLRNSLMGRGSSGGNVNLMRAESLTQSASRALTGLGITGAGDITGQISDVLQLRNTLTSAVSSITAMEGGIAAAGAGFAAALGPVIAIAAPLLLATKIMSDLKAQAEAAAEAQRLEFEERKKNLTEEQRIRVEGRTKSSEQNQQEIADLQAHLKDVSKALADLRMKRQDVNAEINRLAGTQGESAIDPTLEARAKLAELDKQIVELSQHSHESSVQLENNINRIAPLIKKREDEEKATKKLIEAHDLLAQTMREEEAAADQLSLKYEDRNTLVDQAAKEQEEADDRIVDATRKANADIENIEQRALERRASIQDQYNQRIVDITRQAAEAAESALRNLTQQREDLTRDLGRDVEKAERDARVKELDIRIDAQREEARSLREHERNKQRILEDSRDREFELILNRDFLGLFNLRRQTGRDLGRADTDFVAQRQERQTAANDQLSDLRRQMAQERQERLIAYQQQLADAQLAYNRELVQVNQQRAQQLLLAGQQRAAELSQLQAATTAALTLRRNQAAEEIRVAGLVGQARIDYLNQERRALLNQGARYYSSGSTAATGSVFPSTSARAALRDSGGPLAAGQWASIGVEGEAFNGYPLPSGGLFFPTVPGNVTKHTNIQNSWSISGNNPDLIGRVVRGQVEASLRAYLVD